MIDEKQKDSLVKDLEASKTKVWFMYISKESEILQRAIDYIRQYGNIAQLFPDISHKSGVRIGCCDAIGRDLFVSFDCTYQGYKSDFSSDGWYKGQGRASSKIVPQWNTMIDVLIKHIKQ